MLKTQRPKIRGEFPSDLYGIRVGPILAFSKVIAEHAADPAVVLAKAGLEPDTFADGNNRISVDALGRLCQVSELETGCPHVIFQIASRFRIGLLGDLGLLMKHSPTVGQACRNMALHLHLHDRVAVPLLFAPSPGRVALGYSVLNYETMASDKIQDGSLAILFCLMRDLCGPTWKPLFIQFAHAKPEVVQPFKTFFKCTLRFDAQFSAVVFAARWLEHPVEGADPAVYRLLKERLMSSDLELDRGLADRVRRALQSMVLSGTASSDGVASLFGISERTLRRRLEADGTSFQTLLNEALLTLAKQLMKETSLSVSEISAALHYRDLPTFSNAFRRWMGCSPTQWRITVRG
jgi:AraC-like DNA-binding protein